MKKITLLLFILLSQAIRSQDTFSIVAVDTITGEIGSAGASCIDENHITARTMPSREISCLASRSLTESRPGS